MAEMTLEDTIKAYRAGENCELQIWERVRWLVDKEARSFLERSGIAPARADREDLLQSGYLAMISALADYDPDTAGCTFWPYLKNHLRSEFAIAVNGSRSLHAAQDPANTAASLNVPTVEDGPDLIEVIEDPEDNYRETEDQIYNNELRAALEHALELLPANKATVIRQRYFEGQTVQEISARKKIGEKAVYAAIRDGLLQLRRQAKRTGLAIYAEQNFYSGAGTGRFMRTRTSSTERAALRAIRERAEFDRISRLISEMEDLHEAALKRLLGAKYEATGTKGKLHGKENID